ncbi:hypothetical protein IV494_08075 [Kaistella sp. G5-32]|uniref:DNA-directed RNA polymerase n=1 Tax=Kaistella gelatinilytica TaxID=2787636 RepID=A0ABS0FBP7_9FLAO|nr:hypothetical protein [Kaistella gelatinilytica]MBF8457139.1 hypothetical protein [Kaistella gelatinilytica]
MKLKHLNNANLKFNGRTLKAQSVFVKELNWKVILPTKVVNFLAAKIEEMKPFKNFRGEIALYFLSLISSVPARKKDANYFKGFVPLSSKIMEKIKYNYKDYWDYFLSIGIIEKLNYSTNQKKSNSFRYNYKNIKMQGSDYLNFETFDFSKLKENTLKYNSINLEAQTTCRHLLEWFDHGLHLDFPQFLNESSKNFKINKFDDPRDSENKLMEARSFYYSGYDFHLQNWRATRNIESDNRLHTNLTNLDKDIRKYVRYQGEEIKSLDIKNSQPYFLILFIEETLNYSKEGKYKNERLEVIMRNIYGNKSTMFERLSQCANNELFMKEFEVIKGSILSGQYYEFLGNVFEDTLPSYIDTNGIEIYQDKFFCKNSGKLKTLRFSGKRNLMKKVSMQLLYTPLSKPSKYYEAFKTKFPMMCKFMEILKTSSEEIDSYKKFPKLLQHFEADCVLDFVTKKISVKHPEMPLFTIHDSIATTWFWFDLLEIEVQNLLLEYSNGIPPISESEIWQSEIPYENVA